MTKSSNKINNLEKNIYRTYDRIQKLFDETKNISIYVNSCIYHKEHKCENKLILFLDDKFIPHSLGIQDLPICYKLKADEMINLLKERKLNITKLFNSRWKSNKEVIFGKLISKLSAWNHFLNEYENSTNKGESFTKFFNFIAVNENKNSKVNNFHGETVLIHQSKNYWISFDTTYHDIIKPKYQNNKCYIFLTLKSIKYGSLNSEKYKSLETKPNIKYAIRIGFFNKKS
ncbi:hypothetical protein [Mycoplasma hafezii]|uniref:hypothetical protein n=1 Tax=Mycoplasma hafezii TaxID=525886 RepID=UPI003CF33D24